jgi:hypothetical protein
MVSNTKAICSPRLLTKVFLVKDVVEMKLKSLSETKPPRKIAAMWVAKRSWVTVSDADQNEEGLSDGRDWHPKPEDVSKIHV